MKKWGRKRPRNSRESPLVSERPPIGPQRRFRKTVSELATSFLLRLKDHGVDATREEVVSVVRGKAPNSVVVSLVEAWMSDERNMGVEVIDDCASKGS